MLQAIEIWIHYVFAIHCLKFCTTHLIYFWWNRHSRTELFETDDCHLCCWKLQNQRYLEWKVAMVIQNCSARQMGSLNFSLTERNWHCQTRIILESLVSHLKVAMIFPLFEFKSIWIVQISTSTLFNWSYCYENLSLELKIHMKYVKERVVFSNFVILSQTSKYFDT